MFGMREYERNVISAQFWGCFGICLILLAAPYKTYSSTNTFEDKAWIGAPIIWCLGIADPVIGELKNREWDLITRSVVGVVLSMIIFIITSFVFSTPWWFCLIYPEMIVLAEYAGGYFRIDDNGLMLLIPLLMTYVFIPWL